MSEPGVIKRLSEDVVNRIAAGEIIQRPANALKELIENSLDAKASNIIINVKSGGLKFLQIQDNGTGIRQDNLSILCERFTTSKLTKFEDLQDINTYGFRGEALSSISHVAHITITTKTSDSKCAFKASYEDGKLKGPVKPCAGNNGTTITVEDIFYNVTTRKRALKSPNEEYNHIMDVVSSYSIHNSNVGFTLKKFGESADVKTQQCSTVIENVRLIYGNQTARELMEIECSDDMLRTKISGYITNVNYSNKKGVMLLFINHRLVQSNAIKKAIDSVYSNYLPKNAHAFIYLSLEIDPHNVDVNVHPTKHEVQFLHEEQIIDKIKSVIESKLIGCNNTRMLYTQTRLPGTTEMDLAEIKQKDGTKIYAYNLVRSSSDVQKIDKFFQVIKNNEETCQVFEENPVLYNDTAASKINEEPENNIDTSTKLHNEEPLEKSNEIHNVKGKIRQSTNLDSNIVYIDPKDSFKTRKFTSNRIETKLSSVKQLRMSIEKECNMNLRELLANLIFIGCVDLHRSLIQYSTKLYLCNTTSLVEEFFYETILYDFENFGYIKLSNPLCLKELFSIEFNQNSELAVFENKDELIDQMYQLLVDKRAMLNEYFSIEISSDGKLISLPLLLDGHTPFMGALPTYLINLINEVNWESEKECFQTFSRQTAIFYSQPTIDKNIEYWKQEHIIFPAIRKYFLPPSSFVNNGVILQIANLTDLYRVFERC